MKPNEIRQQLKNEAINELLKIVTVPSYFKSGEYSDVHGRTLQLEDIVQDIVWKLHEDLGNINQKKDGADNG